jgi:hypothetical protein
MAQPRVHYGFSLCEDIVHYTPQNFSSSYELNIWGYDWAVCHHYKATLYIVYFTYGLSQLQFNVAAISGWFSFVLVDMIVIISMTLAHFTEAFRR